MIGKIARAAALVLVIAAVAGAAYWHMRLAPYYWVSHARHKSMQQLSEGVAVFNTKHDRLPVSLDELVSDGSLPAEGTLYYSAMKHRSLFTRPLPYRACEFEISFQKDMVVVRIPEAVFADKRYDFVPEEQRSMVITAGVKTIDPRKIRL